MHADWLEKELEGYYLHTESKLSVNAAVVFVQLNVWFAYVGLIPTGSDHHINEI